MEDNEYNVMGIDFGTTNTRVAVWKNGQIELVPNEGGNRLTPSVVSFTESEILIGDYGREAIDGKKDIRYAGAVRHSVLAVYGDE